MQKFNYSHKTKEQDFDSLITWIKTVFWACVSSSKNYIRDRHHDNAKGTFSQQDTPFTADHWIVDYETMNDSYYDSI